MASIERSTWLCTNLFKKYEGEGMKRNPTRFLRFGFVLLAGVWLMLSVLPGCGDKKSRQEAEESFEEALPEEEEGAATEAVVEANPNFSQPPTLSGYVTAICLNIRSDANNRAEVVGHLFKGDAVNIFESRNGWSRINDAAGYVDGWVAGQYISGNPVPSGFTIPDDYKEPRTPTVVTTVSAKYVGVAACKQCHSRPHGEFPLGEYGVLSNHYHAVAYATLSRAYAKKAAERRGIANPLSDWRCLKCHVTAYGVAAERLGPDYTHQEGVGCEACHGPGGDYLNDHWEGKPGFAEREARGFRMFSNLQEREMMCRACHNELSPTYKPFNVEAFSKAIRHWDDSGDYAGIVENLPPTPATTPPKPAPAPPPPPPPASKAVSSAGLDFGKGGTKSAGQAKVTETTAKASEEKDRLFNTPKDMMLDLNGTKGKAFFPHFKHHKYVSAEKEAENCLVCHHTTKAGQRPVPCGDCHKMDPTPKTPNRQDAFHGNCRDCHREEGAGPQKCTECHKS
jgi:hypothetical protein